MYVYKLVNPLDKTVFYIGCTKNPETRYRQHISCAANSSNPVYAYMRHIIKAGAIPEMKIVRVVEKLEDEKTFIRKFSKSHPILNAHSNLWGQKTISFYNDFLKANPRINNRTSHLKYAETKFVKEYLDVVLRKKVNYAYEKNLKTKQIK